MRCSAGSTEGGVGSTAAHVLVTVANVQGQVAQNNATRCQKCAYKKGLCAICGNIVLNTKGYKQSSK